MYRNRYRAQLEQDEKNKELVEGTLERRKLFAMADTNQQDAGAGDTA